MSSNGSKDAGSNKKAPVIVNRNQKTARKVTVKSRGVRGGCCFKRIK